jgi:hypothetical protein
VEKRRTIVGDAVNFAAEWNGQQECWNQLSNFRRHLRAGRP